MGEGCHEGCPSAYIWSWFSRGCTGGAPDPFPFKFSVIRTSQWVAAALCGQQTSNIRVEAHEEWWSLDC